jgi:hypothetical protein
MKVKSARKRSTSASGTLRQNWKKSYGDILSAASHRAPAADLPILSPVEVVMSGVVSACAASPFTRRISSTPAMMLPHWSAPPTCSLQP